MGPNKERRRGIKGRRIYRREASQSDAGNLRRRTQNRPRFDHGLARTTNRIATATDAASDGERRFRFRFGRSRAGHGRPSDFIAGINRRVNKRANKRVNKNVDQAKQGHSYLYEVSRRKVRQRIWTSPHGKGGKEYQPRRRGRIRNNAGSYQPSHAREAVGGDVQSRIQRFDQKSHLGSCSSTEGA